VRVARVERDVARDGRGGGAALGRDHGPVEQREERAEQALEHRGVELALAGEVVVDRLGPDPDPVGHVRRATRRRSALREHLLGGVEDPLRRVLRIAPA